MKKLLGIVVLGLLWCNVGFASDAVGIREPGTDERCFYVYEKENIFKKKFLKKVKKKKGNLREKRRKINKGAFCFSSLD